jgi:hypothetical protein
VLKNSKLTVSFMVIVQISPSECDVYLITTQLSFSVCQRDGSSSNTDYLLAT